MRYFRGRDRLVSALLVAAGRRQMEIEGFTFDLDFRDGIARYLALTGILPPELPNAVLNDVTKSGMVCVDVGASIGYTAMIMARKARVVYAFEPEPRAYAQLVRNVALNGFNVRTEQKACSDQDGTADLYVAGVSSEYSSFRPSGMRGRTERVPTIRLDSWLPEPPDLVKIDVEGAEWQVLRGLDGFLPGPIILIETRDGNPSRFGYRFEEMLAWLEAMDYEVERLGADAICRYGPTV